MRFRSRTAGLLLAAATAAGLTAAVTLPAGASTSPAGYYKILLRVGTDAPGMCLQPADPAGGAGTAIVQQPCAGSQAQHWAPLTISGTSYRFLNQASGLCMDVQGGAASRTPVDQWPCNSISNERWSWPHSFPDSFWPIKSQVAGSSSYCLDVPGASTQAGLGMQIYRCNDTAASGFSMFRTRETRPGPGALFTPGTAVPSRPVNLPGRRTPPSSGRSLFTPVDHSAPGCNCDEASARVHWRSPLPAFPSPAVPGRYGDPRAFPELRTRLSRTQPRTSGRERASGTARSHVISIR